jgi:hypothetical protein
VSCAVWYVGDCDHTDCSMSIIHSVLAIIVGELIGDCNHAANFILILYPALAIIGCELCFLAC